MSILRFANDDIRSSGESLIHDRWWLTTLDPRRPGETIELAGWKPTSVDGRQLNASTLSGNNGVALIAESKPKMERIHCNQCGHKTKHHLVATRSHDGSEPYDDQYDISWSTVYDVLECCGCQEVSLRRRFYFSEWNPGDVEVTFYPPRIARRLPPWKNDLPDEMVALLEEVYTALQADSRGLAMMGARALIDMVILNEVGDVGSFAQKLAALQKAGFLSDKNREILNAALDVGNAASHRGHRPERKHVQNVMDIVENLLHSTILQNVVEDLKQSTPKRKKAKRKK